MTQLIGQFVGLSMVRWWIVGIAFSLANVPMLYALHDRLGIGLALATLVSGEIGTLARFLVNDRWVFGNAVPTWRRLVQYHAAVASSFAIWWVVTNLLPTWGVNYLLASVAGTSCSVGWSMITNFRWIWRTTRFSTPAGAAGPVTLSADD